MRPDCMSPRQMLLFLPRLIGCPPGHVLFEDHPQANPRRGRV